MKRGTTLIKINKMTKIWLSGLAFVMVSLSGSTTFALDLFGPPVSNLLQGQYREGVEYSLGEMDIELIDGKWVEYLNGRVSGSGQAVPLSLNDFETQKLYASLGYGFIDNFEAFVRLGATQAKFGDSIWNNAESFDGSIDFAVGGGIKATIIERDYFKIGGVFQLNWAKYDGKLQASHWTAPDSVEMSLAEMQIAVGIVREWTERISVYAGPFAHFISGDFEDTYSVIDLEESDLKYSEFKWEIDDGPIFGGFVGAQVELAEDLHCNFEFQLSGDAQVLGANLMFRY